MLLDQYAAISIHPELLRKDSSSFKYNIHKSSKSRDNQNTETHNAFVAQGV